jgi:ketosteroid isomerase-like protein
MTPNTDDIQIGLLVDQWAGAVRAKNMDRVVARHAEDIVMFDVPVPLETRGREEYEKTWELFFDNNRGGPGSFDVTELQVTASDTVAYCHALVKIFDSTVRLTMGLRKENGEWLIAHEHHSYPIELKSASDR